jgi:hypothetical protein
MQSGRQDRERTSYCLCPLQICLLEPSPTKRGGKALAQTIRTSGIFLLIYTAHFGRTRELANQSYKPPYRI